MKFNFKMSENSLFAMLLRSSWWISLVVGLGLLLVVRLFVPDDYVWPATSISLPFFGIAAYVAWKQFSRPGAGRVRDTLDAVRAMPLKEFTALLEQAYVREGYRVTRLSGAADLKIIKMGKITLVCGKRCKAASHGAEPLRELDRQREAEDAHDALYIAFDGITENAQAFAAKHRIRIVDGQELTALLRLPKRGKREG
jgi:restriction system protein